MTLMAVEALEIGTYGEAEIIAQSVQDGCNRTPDGWRFLADGLYRSAYVSPTGTVYKVPNYDSQGDDGWLVNEKEYDNFSRLSDRPWAAKCSIHWVDGKPVIAMPLYEHSKGEEGYLDETGREWLREANDEVCDIHFQNYVVVNGRPIIIDAGEIV
jgi:hypothetical protein